MTIQIMWKAGDVSVTIEAPTVAEALALYHGMNTEPPENMLVPKDDEWIEWANAPKTGSPRSGYFQIELRSGAFSAGYARSISWHVTGGAGDVMRYRKVS